MCTHLAGFLVCNYNLCVCVFLVHNVCYYLLLVLTAPQPAVDPVVIIAPIAAVALLLLIIFLILIFIAIL